MRVIGSFFGALLFSFCALTTSYSGSGLWKSSTGENGEYTIEANVEVNGENSLTIEHTLTFSNEETHEFRIVLEKIDDTFYNVIDPATNEVIGSGYCWNHNGEDEKICHSNSIQGDYAVESTVVVTDGAIYSIGSKTHTTTNEQVVWKDAVEENIAE